MFLKIDQEIVHYNSSSVYFLHHNPGALKNYLLKCAERQLRSLRLNKFREISWGPNKLNLSGKLYKPRNVYVLSNSNRAMPIRTRVIASAWCFLCELPELWVSGPLLRGGGSVERKGNRPMAQVGGPP